MFEKEKVSRDEVNEPGLGAPGQETEYAVVIKKSIGDLIGTKLPAAGDIIVSPEGDATCLPMPGLEEEDIKTFLLNFGPSFGKHVLKVSLHVLLFELRSMFLNIARREVR